MLDPQHYEKLGVFYLGREFDLARAGARTIPPLRRQGPDTHARVRRHDRQRQDRPVPRRCSKRPRSTASPRSSSIRRATSATCCLTFPELAPADFRPWVDEDEARAQGLSREHFAARHGADLDARASPTGGRTASASRRCATPPTSRSTRRAAAPACRCRCCGRFDAPAGRCMADARRPCASESARRRAGLLALLGIDADPVQSREHIARRAILAARLARGPRPRSRRARSAPSRRRPFQRVGVLDLESFYPREGALRARDARSTTCSPRRASRRGSRASRSTSQRLLYTPEGKPRICDPLDRAPVGDAERMFFVTMLLERGARLDAHAVAARRACARCSTWTRSSATSRRRRTRRPSCRC